MMTHEYANYVILRALDVAHPNQRKFMVQKILPLLQRARKYLYAKHVILQVENQIRGIQFAFT